MLLIHNVYIIRAATTISGRADLVVDHHMAYPAHIIWNRARHHQIVCVLPPLDRKMMHHHESDYHRHSHNRGSYKNVWLELDAPDSSIEIVGVLQACNFLLWL